MYGIFAYICHKNQPNVGIYIIYAIHVLRHVRLLKRLLKANWNFSSFSAPAGVPGGTNPTNVSTQRQRARFDGHNMGITWSSWSEKIWMHLLGLKALHGWVVVYRHTPMASIPMGLVTGIFICYLAMNDEWLIFMVN